MVRSGHEGGVDAKGCLRMKEKRLQRGGESEGAPPSEVEKRLRPQASAGGKSPKATASAQRSGESEGAPPSEVRNAGVPPANENGAGRADGPQGYAPDPTGGMRW